MRKTVIGDGGRVSRESRRRRARRRVRLGGCEYLRVSLDDVAVWPDDAKDEDFTYTSRVGGAPGPARDCPCGYGPAVHARYCLDCDRAGLDGPLGYRVPPAAPGRWHPNDYPGLAPDSASNPDYVGEDRPSYAPPPDAPARLTRRVRRSKDRGAG